MSNVQCVTWCGLKITDLRLPISLLLGITGLTAKPKSLSPYLNKQDQVSNKVQKGEFQFFTMKSAMKPTNRQIKSLLVRSGLDPVDCKSGSDYSQSWVFRLTSTAGGPWVVTTEVFTRCPVWAPGASLDINHPITPPVSHIRSRVTLNTQQSTRYLQQAGLTKSFFVR